MIFIHKKSVNQEHSALWLLDGVDINKVLNSYDNPFNLSAIMLYFLVLCYFYEEHATSTENGQVTLDFADIRTEQMYT